MPDTSVDLVVPDKSLIDVFGPLPTRVERGEWAPVGARKTAYRQLSRDYAPVGLLELSQNEIDIFTQHGLGDVKKFHAKGKDFVGDYYWFPREPYYTIHRADNAFGLNMIVINAQQHMLSWNIYFNFEQIYPHPVLQSLWHEKFSLSV